MYTRTVRRQSMSRRSDCRLCHTIGPETPIHVV